MPSIPDGDPCFDLSGQRHIGCGSLALAAMTRVFTQKSLAAILFAFKAIVIRGLPCPSDIFDSHHPLQSAVPASFAP
jgi:hypothetical protein